MHSIVVDLGFGDSGKGAITDRLAAQAERATVIRYTGGSQAGHNVIVGSSSHIHSSFASGALAGISSHMSAYCPISPLMLVNEAKVLEEKNGLQTLDYCSVDPRCPLITPYDGMANRRQSAARNAKDTVGVGVGCAMHRHEHSPIRLFAADLLYPEIYLHKLNLVHQWYSGHLSYCDFPGPDLLDLESHFEMLEHVQLYPDLAVLKRPDTFIFEGAQGVLLDRQHGFFPDVTYGTTTVRNAVELLAMIPGEATAHVECVTRSYHTRHGDGKMGMGKPLDLKDATNSWNANQGQFRTAELDFDLLNYAFRINESYFSMQCQGVTLNVTCMDRVQIDTGTAAWLAAFEDVNIRSWYGPERTAHSESQVL